MNNVDNETVINVDGVVSEETQRMDKEVNQSGPTENSGEQHRERQKFMYQVEEGQPAHNDEKPVHAKGMNNGVSADLDTGQPRKHNSVDIKLRSWTRKAQHRTDMDKGGTIIEQLGSKRKSMTVRRNNVRS